MGSRSAQRNFGAAVIGGARGQLVSPGHHVRHGRPERRNFPRQRSRESRDEARRAESLISSLSQWGPTGPQERQEWMDALADVKERVTSVENNQRNLAQSLAAAEHVRACQGVISQEIHRLSIIIFLFGYVVCSGCGTLLDEVKREKLEKR